MAHSLIKTYFVAGILLCLSTQAAFSQNQYTYRMGNQRVQCGHGGLAAGGTSSYITGGTLSQSAQVGAGIASPYANLQSGCSSTGAGAGIVGVNGLPAARMGSTVGMAGDYIRSDIHPNVSFQQQPRRQQYQQYQQRQQVQYNTVNYDMPNNGPASYNYSRSSTSSARNSFSQQSAPARPQVSAPAPAAPAAPAASTAASPASGASGSEYKGY